MRNTFEIRWFFPKPLGPELLFWFEGKAEGSRTDEYVLFPGSDTLGLKLRGNILEMKTCSERTVNSDLAPGVSGVVEQWSKWSTDADLSETLDRMHRGTLRIEVIKNRHVRCFSFSRGIVREIDADCDPERSCQIEVTGIEVHSEKWTSIGVECTGGFSMLLRVWREFVGNEGPAPGISLDTSHSMSYPAWLQNRVALAC